MKISTLTALATLSAAFVNAAPMDEAVAENIVARDDPWDCGALFCPKEKRQGESVPTMTNNGGSVVPFGPPGKVRTWQWQ